MEGAARSAKVAEVRTAGANAVSDEDRNEAPESSARGLPRATLSPRRERLRCLVKIHIATEAT